MVQFQCSYGAVSEQFPNDIDRHWSRNGRNVSHVEGVDGVFHWTGQFQINYHPS